MVNFIKFISLNWNLIENCVSTFQSESFNTSAPASSEPPKPVLEDMSVVAKKGLVGLDQAILQSIDKCGMYK